MNIYYDLKAFVLIISLGNSYHTTTVALSNKMDFNTTCDLDLWPQDSGCSLFVHSLSETPYMVTKLLKLSELTDRHGAIVQLMNAFLLPHSKRVARNMCLLLQSSNTLKCDRQTRWRSNPCVHLIMLLAQNYVHISDLLLKLLPFDWSI